MLRFSIYLRFFEFYKIQRIFLLRYNLAVIIVSVCNFVSINLDNHSIDLKRFKLSTSYQKNAMNHYSVQFFFKYYFRKLSSLIAKIFTINFSFKLSMSFPDRVFDFSTYFITRLLRIFDSHFSSSSSCLRNLKNI